MSHSKYISSPQTTNAARLARVISGPCTDLMRDALRWRIPDTDFNHKLLVYKSSIKHRLSQPQREMLYPQSGSCTARYTDFDISLLYVLLRNICNIIPHSKGWGNPPAPNDNSVSAHIDRIREIRNKYCGHSSLLSLSDSEFSRVWNEVRQIIQCLEFIIPGPSIAYTNAVDILKTVTMDPEQEQKLLDELDIQRKQDTETKKLVEQIRDEQEIQRGIQNQQSEIQVQQGKIQSTHTKMLADHGELLMEYKDTQDRQTTDIQLLKSELKNLHHETENIIAPSVGPESFTYTLESVFNDIENMKMSSDRKVRYCVLAYVFIYNQINTKNIGLPDFNQDFEDIGNLISTRNIRDLDIQDAIDHLKGSYLNTQNEASIYKFSNEIVLEAVLISFGQLEPATVIQKCNASRVLRLIRTDKYEEESGEIILKIPKRHYQGLVEKLFHIYASSGSHFLFEHPCTDDDEFTYYIFYGNQAEERMELCRELIRFLPYYDKPGLINSMLKYHCSDCIRNEADYSVGNNIVLCPKHRCHEFLLTDVDIYYLLDESIYSNQAKNVQTICLYLITQNNCGKHLCRDVKRGTSYSTKCTVLQHCVVKEWRNIVEIILSGYKPSTMEMCRTLSWCVCRENSKMTLALCNYICNLENANEYFDSYIWEVHSDYELMSDTTHTQTGITALHCCVIKGWNEIVSVILGVHTPKKTDKNWTCAHIAAFFGRVNLLKKFVELGQTVTDKTEEGYSVFQCLLLGIRYIDKNISTSYSLDVNETLHYIGELLLDYKSYKESFDYLVSVNSSVSLLEDVSLKLDRHGNSVIHYLVINDCDAMLETLLSLNRDISKLRNETDLPTALHLALYLGRHNMVKKLWMTGIRPDPNDIKLMEAFREGRQYHDKTVFLTDKYEWEQVLEYSYMHQSLKFSTVKFLEVKFGSEDDFFLTQRHLDKLIKE